VEYFTECIILSETQKENKINILNNKQMQLNNTADTTNKHLAPVIRIIYDKCLRIAVDMARCNNWLSFRN